MTTTRHNLELLLDEVTAGRLDALTPEQVEALESRLNDDPAAAARLADALPPADALVTAAAPPAPTEAEWRRVWEGIEAAFATGRSRSAAARMDALRRPRRILRLWESLSAAAACLALALIWQAGPAPASAGWHMSLSPNVEINSLEVFDDSTPMVLYPGEGGAVIWVLDDQEGS